MTPNFAILNRCRVITNAVDDLKDPSHWYDSWTGRQIEATGHPKMCQFNGELNYVYDT
jgi:hypothetical protein